jgi:hypothetical protein
MNPAAKAYQELCDRVAQMTIEEKREFYMEHFAWLVSVSGPDLFWRVRVMCSTPYMLENMGAEYCAQLLDMVNGHIALREMGLIEKQ